VRFVESAPIKCAGMKEIAFVELLKEQRTLWVSRSADDLPDVARSHWDVAHTRKSWLGHLTFHYLLRIYRDVTNN
jgi:hypothetical protein